MESENTPINSKACVICNNVEGDLISVLLKGLQSLTEYSKIRSNRLLLNYLTEEERSNMPNEVFVHKNCRRDYTNPSRIKQKQENIIDDNCVKSTVLQSESKNFNWKTHVLFVEKSLLQIRSTLIAVKVGTKLTPYLFKALC